MHAVLCQHQVAWLTVRIIISCQIPIHGCYAMLCMLYHPLSALQIKMLGIWDSIFTAPVECRMQQAVAVAEQAVEAAEQHERASAETAQAAAAASFAAEAQASKLGGLVKQMQVSSLVQTVLSLISFVCSSQLCLQKR